MGQGEDFRPLYTQDKDGDSSYSTATRYKPRYSDIDTDKIWIFLGEICLQGSYKEEWHHSGWALISQKRWNVLEEDLAVECATKGPNVPMEGMLKYIANQREFK